MTMLDNVRETFTLPAESEAREKKIQAIRDGVHVALSLVLVLSAAALLAINDRSVANYLLVAATLGSWLGLGFLSGKK